MSTFTERIERIARRRAIRGFESKYIQIQPHNPFTWASGWKSPIYYDNRRYLNDYYFRMLGAKGLVLVIKEYFPTVERIVGIPTAGIAPACTTADILKLPLNYARMEKKDHGMKNLFEGLGPEQDFEQSRIVAIEDLVSTGKSSVSIIGAIEKANGNVLGCVSFFSYDFPETTAMFNGLLPYNNRGDNLKNPCKLYPLCTYDALLKIGIKNGYITEKDQSILYNWRQDPQKWSDDWNTAHPE